MFFCLEQAKMPTPLRLTHCKKCRYPRARIWRVKLKNYVCILLLFVPTVSYAQVKQVGNKATITHVNTAVTRTVPSGKAAIKMLAEGRNAFVGQLWLAPGGKVPLHKDPTEEYIFIVSGGGQMTINGQTTAVKSGHMIYMPAGAEVTFQNGPEPLVALQIFSGPASAEKYGKWSLKQP